MLTISDKINSFAGIIIHSKFIDMNELDVLSDSFQLKRRFVLSMKPTIIHEGKEYVAGALSRNLDGWNGIIYYEKGKPINKAKSITMYL